MGVRLTEKRGFLEEIVKVNNLLDRQDCFLVVVDAQERLMPAISDNQSITENMNRLVKFADIVGMPVIFTEQQKLGSTLEPLLVARAESQVVSKITFDCFACPEFAEKVDGMGKKSMLLAGVESHICVAQTALTALVDYKVHVISDAVGSRAPANRQVALDRLARAGAVISSTEMAIYEILGQAGTDEFKKVLPLVK